MAGMRSSSVGTRARGAGEPYAQEDHVTDAATGETELSNLRHPNYMGSCVASMRCGVPNAHPSD
jgi:hypothetical protein